MDSKFRDATEVVSRLSAQGYQAYLVGGCVRDLVMGREPADYDVATDATPEAVVKLYPESLTVGAQFGVVLVPCPAGAVEVATFRSDGRYTDGRHPDQVRYSKTAQEDVQRRDFTINGLLLDPLDSTGQPEERPEVLGPVPDSQLGERLAKAGAGIIDYVGGLADIQARRIRTIGEPVERFSEDRLRMLRAVRFAARFGFTLDPAARDAIRRLAPEIQSTSAERIRDEIVKILIEGRPRRGFELLDETGLLEQILPEVKKMQGVQQPPEFHPEGDVWIHTLMMLDGLSGGLSGQTGSGAPSQPNQEDGAGVAQGERRPSATLALGVLLHDVGKPPTFTVRERIRFDNHMEVGAKMAEEILARLRFSSRETERVVELVRNHLRFKDFPQMRRSTQLRFLRMDGFDEHLELHRLDCLASHRDLTNYHLARRLLDETPPAEIKPVPLVRGDDLIAAGYQPGPIFKQILQTVEDSQLEGRITSREEAMRLVAEQFPLPQP